MSKVMIFDTETTSLNKPFCYNCGYIVADSETGVIYERKDFVIEQIWHNLPLFETAYYAEKRPIYVKRMKARTVKMIKFGYMCREMAKDIKKYNVEYAFAYNSDFDERVFNFNCDWFKCINPFDNVEIKDIRGYAHEFLINEDFKTFCERYELFTDSGNYSTTAETMYKYITNKIDFVEEHTALSDSIIEWEILKECISKGGNIEENYVSKKSIPRIQDKILTIVKGNEKISYKCKGYTFYKSKDTIKLK